MPPKIEEDLRNFILENFLFGQKKTLDTHDSFLEKGILDSTGVLELVTYLEESYNIQVEADELTPENFDSIARLTSFIEHKTAAPKSLVSAVGEPGDFNMNGAVHADSLSSRAKP